MQNFMVLPSIKRRINVWSLGWSHWRSLWKYFVRDSRNHQNWETAEVLQKKLVKYYQQGYLLGWSKKVVDEDGNPEEGMGNQGIQYNHAYGILDIRLALEIQLIRIRNPRDMQNGQEDTLMKMKHGTTRKDSKKNSTMLSKTMALGGWDSMTGAWTTTKCMSAKYFQLHGNSY